MAETAQNVVDLPRKDSAAPELPGVVTEFHIKVSDGQNLQFSTCLSQGDPMSVWNASLDKMRRAGERQKLIFEIGQFERTVILTRRDRDTSERRFALAEREYEQDRMRRAGTVDALRQALVESKAEDVSAWGNSVKRGLYKESTKLASRLNAIEADIRRVDEDQSNADTERDNARKSQRAELNSVKLNLAWFEHEIVMAKDRLVALED